MNLYDIYMDAVNNNDGNPVDSIVINDNEYEVYTRTSNNIHEIIFRADDDFRHDLTIAMVDINGTAIFKNTNPVYVENLRPVSYKSKGNQWHLG